ncbi:MAG TPA: 1-acyl-sn-glycerol-3-phosphate acyltransferase [Anaeromyxobacteraceae bacterium]|nr:1-acyl-sn-glycerol-3-phosphate acyltransferase [Anaeromyxobacteraceae bacterium]
MAARAHSDPGDGPLHRLLRRSLTLPAFFLALAAWVALLPILLPLALARDLVLRRRLAATRFVGAVLAYLAFEGFGVGAVLGLLLARRATLDNLYALEAGWADALLRTVLRLFGMGLQVEGLDALAPGPVLLLGNHVSVADALLPAAIASARRGLRLRYVAKRELLWDPAVDLGCHILPNVFVRRGALDTAGDLARVQSLLDGLGPSDAVVLFPEGTRFTEAKRAAVLAKRAAEGPREHLDRDRRLRSLLPPHLGGLLALLDRGAGVDVVVMGHTGLEGLVKITDLWDGRLLGRTLRVAFWRVPASTIPAGREARIDWIYSQWDRLDVWVSTHRVGYN